MNPLALPEALNALPQFAPSLRMIRSSVRRANRFLQGGKRSGVSDCGKAGALPSKRR